MNEAALAFLGHIFQAPEPGRIESRPETLILVGPDGFITRALGPDDPDHARLVEDFDRRGLLTRLGAGRYLLPGFVDLHIHASQWPQAGKALHLPLYDWLQKGTFPLEARYADPVFARSVYASLVETLLACGSTTALYFATIHQEASLALAEICLERGQRALVGRVAMDLDSPEFYRDPSPQAGLEATESFIKAVRALPGNAAGLAAPVITPRFIPSCGDELLSGLGDLLRRYGCHMQSHCSESDWAHNHVLERLGKRDARALADFGLLTRRSVLAHCNFLDDGDLELFREKGAAAAHCPLSNFYFANSVFPLRHALEKGVHVGLGSDISGGPSPFMLDACRAAVAASRALEDGVDPRLPAEKRGRPGSRIDFREAFWLATAGGGQALELPVGRLEAGFAFDALVLDVNTPHSLVKIWPELDEPEDILQKIIYNAAPSNIVQTWVSGRLVHHK